MKRIVILCDGTWNKADQRYPTNVRQLSLILAKAAPGAVRQVILYFQGVGVPEKGGWLERINETVSGGAMGWGLDDKIAVAYLHLAKHYEPGDQVFIFGFSRGAYTARSLVGLIRNAGLPRDPSPDVVRDCFRLYRGREEGTSPDAPASLEFRQRVSPRVTTGAAEAAWRQAKGHPAGHPFEVTYLGIWDTVGALGIPSHWGLPARALNRKYRFHDTDLSRMVGSARHAVAIDERRRTFLPTLWDNLPALRAANPRGDYQQEWFAGDHGSVGGGGDVVGLSDLTLAWIAEGACLAGLTVPATMFPSLKAGGNPLAALRNQSEERSLGERIMAVTQVWRDGPDDVAHVGHPAAARWHRERAYRPKSLARVGRGLDRFDLASLRDYTAGPDGSRIV